MQDNNVGFVGLGLMGLPMASNLVRGGWQVTGWNRSPGPVAELCNLGAAGAGSVAGLRDLPVIIFMLPDLSHIEDAAAGLLAAWQAKPPEPGTVLVVMSSVSPQRVRDFGRRVETASAGNAAVVDAPVSGGTAGATDGTLAIMAGGTVDDVARITPVLAGIGTTVRHLGGLGSGSLAKACNQLIVGTTTAALAEAAELAERSGIDAGALFEVLAGGLAGSRVLDIMGPRLVAKDYRVTGPAKFMHKDLTFVVESARVAGAAVPLAAAAVDLYAELKTQGLGDQDLTVVRQAISHLSDQAAAHAAEGSVTA
ncbi:2-hydroxy-3-oxopropionate reductase [Arthrobacter sp. ZBG10]|uniref:NAD(P)-dependent oxidoreductase n=1 Tax=Arthrobacter sp. ZBG10 TaxID=1676590 RepID=UPI00068374FB|nr:NAD(P)-dependent oxidoreductase [Arthrobacter sp. ZBG10]KNH18843.1 2-hydroxy-3-oxopropionate reductase [Arthrobacter sp. ZBG10]